MPELTFDLTDESTTDTVLRICAALGAIDYPGPVATEDFYGDPVRCPLCGGSTHTEWDPGGWANKPGRAMNYVVIDHTDMCPWVLARKIADRPYEWIPPWERPDG